MNINVNMNSSSEVYDDTDMRSVENSGPHVRAGASYSVPCSSKSHNRPIADNATVRDRNAGSVVMKAEPISNDELERDNVFASVTTVHVKQEVPELPPDLELPSIKAQEDIADDFSVFDCDSLSEYEVSDSDDGERAFDGFGYSETEAVALNSDESNDARSFEGFQNELICNSEVTETELELEGPIEPYSSTDVNYVPIITETNATDLIAESSFQNAVDAPMKSSSSNGPIPTETLLPSAKTGDDCSFEGFHFDGIGKADIDMNTSKFKAQFLFNYANHPELNDLHSENDSQFSPIQSVPKKTGVSPKQGRTVTKSNVEMEEYIGPFCQAVGCTVSWLESGLKKNVRVNNGIVVELTEFAKKIAWERKYVGEWILRLRGIVSNSVDVSEDDLKKIHMVNKRRKAISVTFSGKNLLKPKLAAFDKEIFVLPSESTASSCKQIGSKEILISTEEKLQNVTSRVLFSQATEIVDTATQSKVEHELNQSLLSRSSDNIPLESISLPICKSNEVQELQQENSIVPPSSSFVDDNSDSEHEMVIDETAYSNDEADRPESSKRNESNGNNVWFCSQKSFNDVKQKTQISTCSPEALNKTSGEKTLVTRSEHLKSSTRSFDSSPGQREKGNNEHGTKKMDFSKSSFGQHIFFASKKGKGDFAGKNVQYPIFEIRDNAIGPFCIRESLDVETLNSPLHKVAVTNGMVIELYIFFKERGATLTSLVYKLHQLMGLPINVTMMQSDMAKIQEVVNIELQKKTDYYLEKEFSFVISQRHLNTAGSSGTYSTKQNTSPRNSADSVNSKPLPCDGVEGRGAAINVVAIESTHLTNKMVNRNENIDGSENSATLSMSLSKPTQESGTPFSPLKTRSQLSSKHGIKKIDLKPADSDEVIMQDLNQCKGKRGCITRGDVVKLYYNWLQLKNKDKDSVFVIDLLSEVEKLMISRGVNVIRIPVGTLMSSSVKLFEEYQRFRLSSLEDALAYLEDDWLEDIQYLVSISKTRRPTVEEQPVVSKNFKVKGKAVVSKDSNPVVATGQGLKHTPRNVEDCVLGQSNDSINNSSDDLKRKKTIIDVEDRSPKKPKLTISGRTKVKEVAGNSDTLEPAIDDEELASLTSSSKIEMVMSCRLTSTLEEPVYEYLVQWRRNNEIRRTWIPESGFPSACIFITNFWENNPLRILKVDKIFKHRNSKMVEPLLEYLVLWNKFKSWSWIREDHLPDQSESVVQSYLSTCGVTTCSQDKLEGDHNLPDLSLKTKRLTASTTPQIISNDSATGFSHLVETDKNDQIVSCPSYAEDTVSNRITISTNTPVLPETSSHHSAANESSNNKGNHDIKGMQACHSSDQQKVPPKEKEENAIDKAQSGLKLGFGEDCSEIENKLPSEMADNISSRESSVCGELCLNPICEIDPDCSSSSGNEKGVHDLHPSHNSFSQKKNSTNFDDETIGNAVQSSSDDKANSTDASPSLLALTDDKENSSDSGKTQKRLNRKCLQPVKRRPRDEVLTDEKLTEMTHLKKVPLSAVFGKKRKYKSLTEAVIQHVNPNYPSDNPTGIELLSYQRFVQRRRNSIVTKGHLLAIYDEWRVSRKRTNTDISVENVATLRNRIKGVFESRDHKYEYDDCLLGVCYSLYLSRLKLETVSDILAFNNTDCINTFKHFKREHSSLLTNFYSLSNSASAAEERNSEVSSTTDFPGSETVKGSGPLSKSWKSLSGKISTLSQASADKNILSNVLVKLKQGISDIEKSIGNHPNNSSEVKKELGGMKQAVTILENGLSSNDKDVDKLQTEVDKEKAMLSLKSSGMKDNDIADLLKLVNQSLPEASL